MASSRNVDRPQLQLFETGLGDAVVSAMFDGSRLTQARALARMTKRELAEAVGVSPAAVGQFEAEVTTPRAEVVSRLTTALGVEPGFLAGGRPSVRVDTAHAHFRSLRSLRARDRELALATAEQLWELTYALERRVRLPEPEVPTLADATPAQAARTLRRLWGLGPGPVKHLAATMESKGIVVSLLGDGLMEKVDAFSTLVADRPFVISTPSKSKEVFRHRFTCAHELGHLMLHGDVLPGDPQHEREANEFAAEFLTPSDEMKSLLPRRMDLTALDRLGRQWGVSAESLVRRMSELRVVSDTAVRRAHQRLVASRPLRPQEPIEGYRGELPSLLRKAMELAEREGTSLVDIATELRWHPGRVRLLLGMPDPRPALQLV